VEIVGYAARDRASLDSHLVELDVLGVPRPERIPTVWVVEGSMLSSSGPLHASPATSSGEAEPVLVRHVGNWYLTIGSDHTDREMERISLAAAKGACPKAIATECWPLALVESHWDSLLVQSSIRLDGAWVPYQEGELALLQPVDWYLSRFSDHAGVDRVVYCGTVPTSSGLRMGAEGFRAQLIDLRRGESLACEYWLPSTRDEVAK
jgi:hypothetical protein